MLQRKGLLCTLPGAHEVQKYVRRKHPACMLCMMASDPAELVSATPTWPCLDVLAILRYVMPPTMAPAAVPMNVFQLSLWFCTP